VAKVLIIYHSMSGNTKAAAEAVAEGAAKVSGAEAVVKEALKADTADLLQCGALAVGTPDYFSYMAGGLKDFFDRTFYPTEGKVTDKPTAVFVTHGGGGKAVASVKSVCRSFKFRLVCEPILIKNQPDEAAREKLRNMGELLGKMAVDAKK